MNSTPLIGLTTYRSLNSPKNPQISIGEAYIRAVSSAGGLPVAIPLGLSETNLDLILERIDGIIFTGGGDIAPEVYQSNPHPLVNAVDTDRDRIELHLLHRVINRRMPFFGICRGLQVLNVALGGTLFEDILDQYAGAIRHQFSSDHPRDYLAHSVQVHRGSRLAEITGREELEVNSLHHQGIRRLAESLSPVAFAPDGLVEAVELEDYPFGLAVQWHPEWLAAHRPMQTLFSTFVNTAGEMLVHHC